jgi:NADH-quinone oxidoreductase subunit J
MTATFIILAIITIAGSVAAMTLRNLVHCALALTITFAGLAALYLHLDAQFAGFAQLLVYIGAVAILIVFVVLLTRGSDTPQGAVFSSGWVAGVAVAALVFGVLAYMIRGSHAIGQAAPAAPDVSVRQIGDQLMIKYVLPLEVVGLLLTAALIGAVIIAMREPEQT